MEHSRKILQVVLPNNRDKRKKIVCKVDSKHLQIGDSNKTIVDARFFGGADNVPSTRFDLEDVIGTNTELVIEGDIVQVVPNEENWPDYMNIAVNPTREDSTVQIGDKTELRLKSDDTEFDGRPKKYRPKRKKKRNTEKKVDEKSLTQGRETPLLSRESKELYDEFFREVLPVLHPLRDDGKWDEFDEKLNEFRVAHHGNTAWDILLTLEQGQQICYHSFESNIKKAESILYKGLDMVKKAKDLDPSISQLCEGRAFCYLASVYRRVKIFGKAQQCLERAERCLKNTSFLYDEASLNYEKASLLVLFDQKPEGSYARKVMAEKCLDKCSELCDEINKDEKWEFVKKGSFAKLKKASLLLDCSTKPGRKRKISDENLEEAKKFLEELEQENQTRRQVPAVSEQIVGLLAKSDKEFRCQCFCKAKENAEKAIALANNHGFEEKSAFNRLQDIETMIGLEPAETHQPLMNGDVMSGDADVSTTADETEW